MIEQGFVCLVNSPNFDEITVEVIDHNKKEEVLGSTTIRVSSLISQPGMEYSLQPWILKGGNITNATIVMSASLRGLMSPQASTVKPDKVQIAEKILIKPKH